MQPAFSHIDIHCHPNFPDYDADREIVISRAQDARVAMIAVGTSVETSRQAVELARTHDGIWAAVGIHPNDTADSIGFPLLTQLAQDRQVVAIGECGLDYFRSKPELAATQKEVLERHISLANQVKKPLMLHVRNGKTVGAPAESGANAYADAVAILRSQAQVRSNFHFFAGSIDDLRSILDLGCTVSFTGVLTFTRDYDELVKYAPLERIMTETDSPFVAPAPHRGKRNEPINVIEVAKAIARIKGVDEGIASAQLLSNARSFFGLS